MSGPQILFVCVENAGRSQMAEGFFREYAQKFEVVSAGTSPESKLIPIVVDVMKEVGIGITNPSEKLDVIGNINASTGSSFKINNTDVITSTGLGSGVVSSSLTSLVDRGAEAP